MSRPEDLRAVARLVLAPDDLLRGYSGDVAGAARDAYTRGSWGQVGGVEWATSGGRVTYRVGDTEGTATMRDLVRVGVDAATRGAVDRLAAAVEAHRAAHRSAALLGPLQAAQREVTAAVDAWWDGPTGQQLDLFGAAS